jgi:hypothetical protein
MKNLTHVLQIVILIAITILFSCKKESDKTCDVSNPEEDLVWLKDTINDLKAQPDGGMYSYVSMAKYNGETVFLIGYCNPLANYVIPVLNCSGEGLGIIGEISQDKLSDQQVIWKSENSLCFSR